MAKRGTRRVSRCGVMKEITESSLLDVTVELGSTWNERLRLVSGDAGRRVGDATKDELPFRVRA